MQRIGNPLHELFVDLAKSEWETDYGSLSGTGYLESPGVEVAIKSTFTFLLGSEEIQVGFSVETKHALGRHSRRFLKHLKVRLEQQKMQLVWEEDGSFKLAWSIVRPEVFQAYRKEGFERELNSQIEGGRQLCLSCAHALKSYAQLARQRRLRGREWRSHSPSALSDFCLLQADSNQKH